MERVDPPRELTDWERGVLARLAPEATSERIAALRVHERCACGCASVSFRPDVRAHFSIAEAEGHDSDGHAIWLILFGPRDDQDVDEFDIQRADGEPIRELPAPESLAIRHVTSWH